MLGTRYGCCHETVAWQAEYRSAHLREKSRLWDVRTLLDDDFKLDPATVQQASQVAELVTRVLVGGKNWMTISLQSRNSDAIDFVEPREDHVTATLRARLGVKH